MQAPDIEAVARLHAECLPDSIVTTLGRPYAESFYGYIARSPYELLAVERDDEGRVVAAGVLSLQPATLTRRLLRHTSLLRHALMSLPRMIALAARAVAGSRDLANGREIAASAPAVRPQLILLFTAPARRGEGRATSLIGALEARLRERGIAEYEVRTDADPRNKALAFYDRRGFQTAGECVRLGMRFRVFTRTLAADAAARLPSDHSTNA